jgi:hypothetical protein
LAVTAAIPSLRADAGTQLVGDTQGVSGGRRPRHTASRTACALSSRPS